MNVLYPKITWRQFCRLLGFGAAGALIAGGYGILHDQVTYTIGPEYFTRLKFQQFHYLPPGQPLRLLVAEIGFLATWWVGFISAWFMGRITVPHEPLSRAMRRTGMGVMTILITALLAAIVASFLAPAELSDARLANWTPLLRVLHVSDPLAFVRVAYIHNASYLGGLIGLVSSLIWLRCSRRK